MNKDKLTQEVKLTRTHPKFNDLGTPVLTYSKTTSSTLYDGDRPKTIEDVPSLFKVKPLYKMGSKVTSTKLETDRLIFPDSVFVIVGICLTEDLKQYEYKCCENPFSADRVNFLEHELTPCTNLKG